MMDVLRRVTVLAALLAWPLEASARERPWDVWVVHPMWGGWSLWGVGMMLAMFAFWALVIAALVLGIRRLFGEEDKAQPDRALAALRERYARGEMDKDEFEARRRDLDAA